MKKEVTTNDKMKKVFDNGIKIYPVTDARGRFAVMVEDSQNILYRNKNTKGEHKHSQKSVNDAILSTLDYIYNKL